MSNVTPQGARLRAIMADHDRGPEYALIECIAPGCSQQHRIENSYSLSTEQITTMLAEQGWHVGPTLCPEHSRTDSPISWVLIQRQYSRDIALIYPDRQTALAALDDDLLVDSLCEEDCLDAWTPDAISPEELRDYEIIIPD